MFQKIRPKRISDEIYEQLKSLILEGELKPGSKLPPERDLAMEMGVSRPSLREAIHRLVAQGLLEQVQGGGTYVQSITTKSFDAAIEEYTKKDGAIFDLIEMRKILETWAALTAAQRATDEEIAQMKDYLEEMRTAKERGEIGYISDANFHSTISYASHNIMLIHMMNNLYQWIETVSYEVRSRMYQKPDSHQALFDQHERIYKAIANRKPQEAYKAMTRHVDYIIDEINSIFKDSIPQENASNGEKDH